MNCCWCSPAGIDFSRWRYPVREKIAFWISEKVTALSTLSFFLAWVRASSARLRSVISRTTPMIPATMPSVSRITDPEKLIGMALPPANGVLFHNRRAIPALGELRQSLPCQILRKRYRRPVGRCIVLPKSPPFCKEHGSPRRYSRPGSG